MTAADHLFSTDILKMISITIPGEVSPMTSVISVTGKHSVTVRAWDNFNNSSEASLDFYVEPDDKFILRNLINYPNPFTGETRISAEHNRPDDELDITINIFSLDGRIIKILKTTVTSSGFVLTPVVWDGTLEGGKRAGRGIYPLQCNRHHSQR